MIDQNQYSEIVRNMKFLLDIGKVTRKEAEITLDRIVKKYELTPIYVW